MQLENFIARINSAFNSHRLTEDLEYLTGMLLPKQNRDSMSISGEFLTDLYRNFELQGRSLGFEFKHKLSEEDDFIFFASQDVMQIGVEKASGEVVMFDNEFDRVHHRLAPDLDTFLEICVKIYEYDLPGFFEEKTYAPEDRRSLYLQLESILPETYLKYYSESYNT